MSTKRYHAYRDSQIERVGETPIEWDEKPLWALASCNDEVLTEATPKDFLMRYVEISDVDPIKGVVGSTDVEFGNAPSRARRKVRHGDIIVSTVRTYLRAIAPIHEPSDNMIVSTGFAVMRPTAVHPIFLAYLFRSEFVVSEIISRSVGVSYPAINASEIRRLKVPVPPAAEQAAIATFLDRETAKTDALVAEQEQLIALLQEKRQAVITQAVTKGLNPDAPMKPSGVEWLGDVPAHWELTHIKRYCGTITDGAHISPDTEEGIFDFVSTKDLKDDLIDFQGSLKTSQASYDYMVQMGCRPEAGDVLFSKDGTIGRTALVVGQRDFVVASSLIIVRPDPSILSSEFLFWLLQSSLVISQVECFVKGAGLPRLSIQNLLKVVGTFPPNGEQAQIATAVADVVAEIRQLITTSEQAISLLKERRAALISAAVTGKIDVRNLVQRTTEQARAA